MIVEIHFTTLYMADLGTRVVFHLNTNRNHSQLKPLRRRETRDTEFCGVPFLVQVE
jgi:hypothetical protein